MDLNNSGGRDPGKRAEVITCLRLLEEDRLLSNLLEESKNTGKKYYMNYFPFIFIFLEQ